MLRILLIINIILFIATGLDGSLVTRPSSKVVQEGNGFTLTCSTDLPGIPLKWSIIVAGGGQRTIYEGGTVKTPDNTLYNLNAYTNGASTWNYDLQTKAGITLSQSELAGEYICTDRDGSGPDSASARIVIVEKCSQTVGSNISKPLRDGEVVRLSYVSTYRGSIPPSCAFSLSNGTILTGLNVLDTANANINFTLDLRMEQGLNESMVICSLNFSQVSDPSPPDCSMTIATLQLRYLKCEKERLVSPGRPIDCEANGNPVPQSFLWKNLNNSDQVLPNASRLPAEYVIPGSRYMCAAIVDDTDSCNQTLTVCSIPINSVWDWATAVVVISTFAIVANLMYSVYWLLFYNSESIPLYIGLLLIIIPATMIMIGSAVVLDQIQRLYSDGFSCLDVSAHGWSIALILLYTIILVAAVILLILVAFLAGKTRLSIKSNYLRLSKVIFGLSIIYALISLACLAWTLVLMRDIREKIYGYADEYSWEVFLIVLTISFGIGVYINK